MIGNWERFKKYCLAIIVGMPLWFVVGVLVTFSPEFGKIHLLSSPIVAGKSVMLAFLGQAFGNMACGFLSQKLQSRKKAVGIFMILSFVSMILYLKTNIKTETIFYSLIFLLGICNGYWTIFIVMAAELFGTNIRATVSTSIPNFVRGTAIPITALFAYFKLSLGIQNSGVLMASLVVASSLIALIFLEETFNKDMNYIEE